MKPKKIMRGEWYWKVFIIAKDQCSIIYALERMLKRPGWTME